MCTIDKMIIKGVRSFSPDNQNVIEFFRPLTLIVGHNGAGKTTVIECLKEACTGELPPNCRSGQSFIHDPKVAGEHEVKAQIKLRFLTATGSPVVVSRSFQLTQKKATLQFKTLDSVLQTYNKEGEKQAVTYRCADMDRLVPSLMGVSKAVLENVIFVHQEDSSWPLAEGQVLKKKFDDIFSATKYTKALEALRKLRTEKAGEVKVLKLQLENLRTHKENAQRLRSTADDARRNAAQYAADIQRLEEEMEAQGAIMESLSEKLAAFARIRSESNTLKQRLEHTQRQSAEMRARLVDYDDDTDTAEVEEMLRGIDSERGVLSTRVEAVKREITGKRMECDSFKDQYARECKRHGRLAAEAEAHAASIAARDAFIRQKAPELGMQVQQDAAGQLTAATVGEFERRVQAKLKELDTSLRALKAEHRSQDEELARALDAANAQISGAAESVRLKEATRRKNVAKIEELHGQIGRTVVSDSLISETEGRVKTSDEALQRRKQEQVKLNFAASLAQKDAELDALRRKIDSLRQEKDTLSASGQRTAQLQLLRQNLSEKRAAIDTQLAAKRTRLLDLLETTSLPAVGSLRAAASAVLQRREATVQSKSDEVQELQKRVSVAQGNLNAARQQLQQSQQDYRRTESELSTGMLAALGAEHEADTFSDKLSHAEQGLTKKRDSSQQAQSLHKVLESYRRQAEADNACGLCRRPFRGDELATCIAHMESEMQTLPGRIKELTLKAKKVEQELSALKKLQPLWVRYSDLRHRYIPAQTQKVAQLESELRELEGALATASEDHDALAGELQSSRALVQEVVWQVDRLQNEATQLQHSIERQQGAMSSSLGTARNIDDVEPELEEAEHRRKTVDADKDNLIRQQNRIKDSLMALQDELHKARDDLSRLLTARNTRNEYEKQITELTQQNELLDREVQEAKAKQQPLLQQRDACNAERQTQRRLAADKEAAAEEARREFERLSEQLSSKAQPIAEYVAANKAGELQQVSDKLNKLQERIQAHEQAVTALEAEQRTKSHQEQEHSVMKRDLQDVLDYRRVKAQETEMQQQLERLEKANLELGSYSEYLSRSTAATDAKFQMRRQQDMARGSKAAEEAAAKRAEDDLAAVQYKDIDQRFSHMSVALKTNNMVNEDLEKYHKALEKALLTFHTTKMGDINKIIKELWQKTYRGQDIDYIQIRADADGQRSYNYRVAMFSGGAELDMRGRCSAGQKVLACLIIRLALAETFCLNCGILALDEPTTNLDAENSASLAEALRSIMLSRRDQENFQLIIITHDEAFAHSIGTREHAEYMWRITKDESQHTHVAKEEIAAS